MSLEALRTELAEVDRQILALVERRQALVAAVGEAKDATDRALRDFGQEREVIERARATAADLGISADVAEELVKLLVRYALTLQERQRVASRASGGGRRAVVIGGSGRMGGWFARFLASQDFDVEIADPAPSPDDYPRIENWTASSLDHDMIVVATDLRTTQGILVELAQRRPPGIVLDIGSLKTPLRDALGRLRRAGVRVTSIHPMFGPDTEMLSGKHVILVDQGSADANDSVRALFAPTMVQVVDMGLDEHDRIVAWVLGLSHALNIAFFAALQRSGYALSALARLASTTFDHQLGVASRVARENPHLYFEIQQLNAFGLHSLSALRDAVAGLHRAVETGDEGSFVRWMKAGADYMAPTAE